MSSLRLIRGKPVNPTFNAEQLEDIIDNFVTRDGDVFVAAFVKAGGATWLQQLLHSILQNGKPGGFYAESVPWLESLASDALAGIEAPGWSMDRFISARSPRYFKTHAAVENLPRGKGKIKVIYVARNPKDAVVNLYHHERNRAEFQFTGDFYSFFRRFLVGNVENGCWFEHVLGWYRYAQVSYGAAALLTMCFFLCLLIYLFIYLYNMDDCIKCLLLS
jgi:hypothetical protein